MGGNTYYSSREEMLQLEGPLLAIDFILDEYAKKYNLSIEKNYHNFNRSLDWIDFGRVKKGISIGLKDEEGSSFIMGAMAWEDREDGRYTKYKCFAENLRPPFKGEEIIALLDKARKEVSSWTRDDLKKAYPDGGKKKKK